LLRADLHARLAALGRGRDHREEGRSRSLYDDPELVEQRVQPGDEACRGLRGLRDGVDRRQHRLEGHDEVPVDLPAGQGRAGRGALGRVRRRGAAHGRRRKGDPLRAVHDLDHQQQVGVQGRRAHRLPRARAGRAGCPPREVDGAVRRPDPRRDLALGHLPVRRGRGADGAARPRGIGRPNRRGPALLPDEPGSSSRSPGSSRWSTRSSSTG
jgi:hypothetical protein